MTADNWGCPEWRDSSAYPSSPDSLEDWQWQWEFLRRTPEYRDLWGKRNEPEVIRGFQWGGLYRDKFQLEFDIPTPFETPQEMPFVNFGGGDFYLPPKDRLKKLWNSMLQAEPAEKLVSDIAEYLYRLDLTNDKETKRKAFIQFDLTKPIDYQLGIAKKQLEVLREQFDLSSEASPKLFGESRRTWSRHLRIIDAKDQGATHQEIYDHFVEELAGDDEDLQDHYHRLVKTKKTKDQESIGKATVSQWHKQAMEVMEKASRFL